MISRHRERKRERKENRLTERAETNKEKGGDLRQIAHFRILTEAGPILQSKLVGSIFNYTEFTFKVIFLASQDHRSIY